VSLVFVMKKELGAIVIFLGMILGTSCNKEEMFEKVDLNGNGTKEIIWNGYISKKGHALYYFDGSPYDTNYIIKGLKSKPINPNIYDFEKDGYPEILYGVDVKGGTTNYRIENEGGSFGEAKEF